ncbi:uncharacterized protein DEA37_0010545 [Paragonimus westermani]|uniref:Uncharacterized protein n=1 Tax=Paragonimus westermani TaxID=34504 RepID=A0A5J4ND22_9TREM|nr:uncharacterized protein DEA37_0010545 [Paragonimus westermani]
MANITRYIHCSRPTLLHRFPELVQSCFTQLSSCKTATLKQPDSIVSRKYFNVIKRYRKVLQDLFQTETLAEGSSMLQITEIKPGNIPGHFDVICSLPCCTAPNSDAQSETTSLALKLECGVNSHASELRSRFCHYRKMQKFPSFRFLIQTESNPVSHLHDPETEPESPHPFICTSSTEDQSVRESDFLSDFVMPTNAYGLPRDQLLQKIRSASKKHELCNWDETGPGRFRSSDSRASADWARFWKQRQDWRTVARRDRRRIRQNTGLYRLTMGHNGVLDIVDEDDSMQN